MSDNNRRPFLHSLTGKPVGRFYRSAATAPYWQGGCTCGSGREGRELDDARGFYCCIVCDECEKEQRSKFRLEVFSDPSYETDEPIDEED